MQHHALVSPSWLQALSRQVNNLAAADAADIEAVHQAEARAQARKAKAAAKAEGSKAQ